MGMSFDKLRTNELPVYLPLSAHQGRGVCWLAHVYLPISGKRDLSYLRRLLSGADAEGDWYGNEGDGCGEVERGSHI